MHLRILCGLFVIPALTVLAQQQPAAPSGTGNRAMDRAIQAMIHQDFSGQPLLSLRPLEAKPQAPTVCSVPLLEMAIPKDVDFTMKVIPPAP